MGGRSLPPVSVVIPHKGDQDCLRRCLEALAGQTYPFSKIEILVVLNEPPTQHISIPVASNVTLLRQPEGHSYAARNMGIRLARGDLIAFTDSDTVPAPTWIENGLRALAGGAVMVAGRIELTFENQPLTPSACYEKLYAFDQEKNCELGRSVTANLIVSSSLFHQYGPFLEEATTGEDFDWTIRATDAGEKMVFGSDAVVYHPARESLGQLIKKARRDSMCPKADTRTFFLLRYGFRRWSEKYLGRPSTERRATLTKMEIVKAIPVALAIQAVKLVTFFACALTPAAAQRETGS